MRAVVALAVLALAACTPRCPQQQCDGGVPAGASCSVKGQMCLSGSASEAVRFGTAVEHECDGTQWVAGTCKL